MKVVACNELGSIDKLVLEERPDPAPGPGQVCIRVEAAGVNFVDILFVGGKYQIRPVFLENAFEQSQDVSAGLVVPAFHTHF